MHQALLVVSLLVGASAFALEVGPPVLVAPNDDATQQNVTISRDSYRTLIAFDELTGGAAEPRVILHQYEVNSGVKLGRETFVVDESTKNQRRPALGDGLAAWVAEDPAQGGSWVWYRAAWALRVGDSFEPWGRTERLAQVAPGSRLAVLHAHVFHIPVWTAPDGRLKAAYRSLIARIGYDPSEFYVTNEAGVNPVGGDAWGSNPPLLAYNHPVAVEGCDTCAPNYAVRATIIAAMQPQQTIEIAPAGASEPRLVFDGTDYFVFWSTDEGTYAQRVNVTGVVATKLGEPRKIDDAPLHGATLGPNRETYIVVGDHSQYSIIRLDNELDRLSTAPFFAHVAEGTRISISGDQWMLPMLAYAEPHPADASKSRAVFRVVSDRTTPSRRRSVR